MRSGENERGAVAAEFAIVLPVLVLLIFAIIQLGIAYNRQQAVHAAAREGARLASLPTTSDSAACTRAIDALAGIAFEDDPVCDVDGSCESATATSVVVTVEGVTLLEIPFWGSQSLTLTGRGSFRCE